MILAQGATYCGVMVYRPWGAALLVNLPRRVHPRARLLPAQKSHTHRGGRVSFWTVFSDVAAFAWRRALLDHAR